MQWKKKWQSYTSSLVRCNVLAHMSARVRDVAVTCEPEYIRIYDLHMHSSRAPSRVPYED